jgi:hypothetical protein
MQAIFAPAFNLEQWIKPNERFVYASLPGEFTRWDADVKSLDSELARLRTDLAQWVRVNRPRGEVLFFDDFDSLPEVLGERWSNTAPGDNGSGGTVAVNIGSTTAPGLVINDGRLRVIEGNTQGDSWVSTREKFNWTPETIGAAVQVTFDLIADRLDDTGRHAERIGYFIALHDFNDDSGTAGGNLLIDGHPGGPTAVDLDYPGADAKRLGDIGGAGYKPGRNYGVRITRVEDDKYKLEHLVDFYPDGKSLLLSKSDLPEGGFGFEYCCGRSFEVDNVLIERFAGSLDSAPHEEFHKERDSRKKPLDEAQKRRAALDERPGKIAWVGDASATAPDVFLLERGDYGKPSIKVEPAGLAILSDERHPFIVQPPSGSMKSTGRRLAFANWATAPGSSPEALLARVQVNRLWQNHFGTGIVATADNLGVTGASPSHPELLDWLAHTLVTPLALPPLHKGGPGEVPSATQGPQHGASASPPLRKGGQGGSSGREIENSKVQNENCKLEDGAWSLKRIHRLILNSAAYRQAGSNDERAKQVDPDNRLLWRFPVRRLDAEAIRDALLAVSGDLEARPGGPAISTKRTDAGEVIADDSNGGGRRRAIYLKQKRTQVVSFLAVFDAPSIVFNSVQRPNSTLPLQALALLNSEFILDRARSFAARLERGATEESARLRFAYLTAFGRAPDEHELQTAREFLNSQTTEYHAEPDARAHAWVDFCQMLLASNEFLYIE